MCGQPGNMGQGMNQRPQQGIIPPRFNPMTLDPNGGPPGHYLNQWQNQGPQVFGAPGGGIVPPRFAPHSFGNRFSGSTATGEPAAYGQAVQPFQPPQAQPQGNPFGDPFGQGQIVPPDFNFARRYTRS